MAHPAIACRDPAFASWVGWTEHKSKLRIPAVRRPTVKPRCSR
jgi:hypothetical protein